MKISVLASGNKRCGWYPQGPFYYSLHFALTLEFK